MACGQVFTELIQSSYGEGVSVKTFHHKRRQPAAAKISKKLWLHFIAKLCFRLVVSNIVQIFSPCIGSTLHRKKNSPWWHALIERVIMGKFCKVYNPSNIQRAFSKAVYFGSRRINSLCQKISSMYLDEVHLNVLHLDVLHLDEVRDGVDTYVMHISQPLPEYEYFVTCGEEYSSVACQPFWLMSIASTTQTTLRVENPHRPKLYKKQQPYLIPWSSDHEFSVKWEPANVINNWQIVKGPCSGDNWGELS